MNPPETKYDIFIAYSSPCIEHAIAVYNLFSESHKVFLDKYTLKVGQNWAKEIPNAQASSLVTIALISNVAEPTHYAQDEVAAGIAFELTWGESRHRLIPVYIDEFPIDPLKIPYGLRCRQGYVLKDDRLVSNFGNIKGQIDLIQASNLAKKQSDSIFEHPLKKYPTYPLVPPELTSSSLIQSYAYLIRQYEALQVVADANRFRKEADPDNPNVGLIKEIHLLPVHTVQAYAFWLSVFHEARLQGPRMLAALLMILPDDQFEERPKNDRRELLENVLININN